MLLKNVNNKNVLLNLYSSMKKTPRKLTLKVTFWNFLTPPHYTNS
jgi:hypothetical protein